MILTDIRAGNARKVLTAVRVCSRAPAAPVQRAGLCSACPLLATGWHSQGSRDAHRHRHSLKFSVEAGEDSSPTAAILVTSLHCFSRARGWRSLDRRPRRTHSWRIFCPGRTLAACRAGQGQVTAPPAGAGQAGGQGGSKSRLLPLQLRAAPPEAGILQLCSHPLCQGRTKSILLR